MIFIETPKFTNDDLSTNSKDPNLENYNQKNNTNQNITFLKNSNLPFNIYSFISTNWTMLTSTYPAVNSVQIHYNFSRIGDPITPINIVWWGHYNPDILEFYESILKDRLGIHLLGITCIMQFSFLGNSKIEYLSYKRAFLDHILDRDPASSASDGCNPDMVRSFRQMCNKRFQKNRIDFRFKTPLRVSDYDVRALLIRSPIIDGKSEILNDIRNENIDERIKNDSKAKFFYILMRKAFQNMVSLKDICERTEDKGEYYEIFHKLVSNPDLSDWFGDQSNPPHIHSSQLNDPSNNVYQIVSKIEIDNINLHPGVPYFSIRFHIDKELLKMRLSLAEFLFNIIAFQIPLSTPWNIAVGCLDFNFKSKSKNNLNLTDEDTEPEIN